MSHQQKDLRAGPVERKNERGGEQELRERQTDRQRARVRDGLIIYEKFDVQAVMQEIYKETSFGKIQRMS